MLVSAAAPIPPFNILVSSQNHLLFPRREV
jgi:hypothetical protein